MMNNERPSLKRDLYKLYQEICTHRSACYVNRASLSDTWMQTLKHWESNCSYEAMIQMFSPESKVNTWIDDTNYFVDATVLNLRAPIARTLFEQGESEFGNPRQDIKFKGRTFGSSFVHNVFDASRIIKMIEARGIKEPAIMEIGGGLGGLTALLRSYFKDKLTLYLVDIPETLLLQEWHLRARFPEAKTSYKPGSNSVVFEKGGLNFINAYVVSSQICEIDVAINIDSMQEMDASIANGYVKYIEQTIRPNGFFYFQNQFGHTSSPLSEPSECDLDKFWTIESAEIAYQIETCSEAEQARLIFARTSSQENPATRRLILRVIWNGLLTGQISNSDVLISEFANIAKYHTPTSALCEIKNALERHGIVLDNSVLDSLKEEVLFPVTSFPAIFNSNPVLIREKKTFTQIHAENAWCIQSKILKLMAAGEVNSLGQIKDSIEALCKNHFLLLENTSDSDYWSAYFAAIFLVLQQHELARNILMERAEKSLSSLWLTRSAYLLSRFKLLNEANIILKTLEESPTNDYYLLLKQAEIFSSVGEVTKSHRFLEILEQHRGIEFWRSFSLAMTSARTGAFALTRDLARDLIDRFQNSRAALILNIVRKIKSGSTNIDQHKKFISELVELCGYSVGDVNSSLAYGALLIEEGAKEDGKKIMLTALKKAPPDYYTLARIGRLLQEVGLDEFADEALSKSIELRPNAFLHYDYVGSIYLSANRHKKAQTNFEKSLLVKPYLRHIQAKYLYSRLPTKFRDSGIFGVAEDIPLVFQRRQDFYHDLGLTNKPNF